MKILVIDNYDSFTYNLVQLVGKFTSDIIVKRNDEINIEEIKELNPDKILISPGPGRPENSNISLVVIQELGKTIPVLGVCLGHKGIGYCFGSKIINAIAPEKDVDGFHPVSVGNLVIGNDTFFPCTPAGIQELLKRYNIQTKGKHVVVVGRSNIVGKPIANILLQKKEFANAIVTVCHSAAADLKKYTLSADILIAAIGVPNFIKADMVQEGTVVIDVGINRVEDATQAKGYKIVGDVDFENVSPKASFITPVPGGVGPMTIAMLLQNTFKAYLKFRK